MNSASKTHIASPISLPGTLFTRYQKRRLTRIAHRIPPPISPKKIRIGPNLLDFNKSPKKTMMAQLVNINDEMHLLMFLIGLVHYQKHRDD